jgi:hypothetical protein
MSQTPSPDFPVVASFLLLLAGFCGAASAQTIADYSAAQRAALQAEMTRLTAPSQAASAAQQGPTTAPAVAVASKPVAMDPPVSARPLPRFEVQEPSIEVAGVTLLRGRAMVELAIRGRVHVLQPGMKVPGSSWSVDAVSANEVVLTRTSSATPLAPRGTDKRKSPKAAQLERRVFQLDPIAKSS